MFAYKNIEELKEKYPCGTKVVLEYMHGEPQMKSGLTGIINYIDDAGQIHVNWENGSTLALIPGIDRWMIKT